MRGDKFKERFDFAMKRQRGMGCLPKGPICAMPYGTVMRDVGVTARISPGRGVKGDKVDKILDFVMK